MRIWLCLMVWVGVAAADPKPELWLARDAADGPTDVIWHGGRHARAKLTTTVAPTFVETIPADNANATYQLRVGLAAPVPDGLWPVIGLGGSFWRAESQGGSGTTGDASFTLDRATAAALAKAFGVPLRERTKLGDGLVYAWTIPRRASAKQPIAIVLRVSNPTQATVGFVVGGMMGERGDGRFVPEIRGAGKPVPLVEVHGANGGFAYQKLAPGGHLEVTTDLRGYVVGGLSAPGHYAIAIRYDGQLQDGANLWDVAPATTGELDVTPD